MTFFFCNFGLFTLVLMYLFCILLYVRTEEIHEGSQAIVEAVNFLTGNRNLAGTRNSQMLQPTIATQNVSSYAYCLLSLSFTLVESNPSSILAVYSRRVMKVALLKV